MHELFSKLASSSIKPMNSAVMEGLACYHIPKALEYVDTVMRSASHSFPQGLEYVGCRRCTPEEEYNESCRQKNNKRQFDLARSDLYLAMFLFTFQGEPIPVRYIYLPYVLDAGIIHLGGPSFHITPVLSDKVISPGFNSVFVKLLRDKIIFKRLFHPILINGVAESKQVIYAEIYRNKNRNSSVPRTTDALTCVGHYLFACYGVSQTFAKYCGFIPEFGGEEINSETHPASEWTIFESRGIKPKSYRDKFYEPAGVRVAVKNTQLTPLVNQLICEFFYVVDHFPDRIKKEYIDKTDMWKILLGHIIFSGNFSEGKLHGNIVEHFQSLREYADLIVIEKLKEKGFYIEDFFDLLALILAEFHNFLHHTASDNNNVYQKTFEVLSYVLYDITAGIFSTSFKLSKLATKKVLTAKDVSETFNKHLKIGSIYGLSSGKVVANGVSYSGDHKYPKITSTVNQQETLAGSNRGRRARRTISQEHRVHTSSLEIGSLLFLPKSNPTPIVRINPYVDIDLQTGSIKQKPHLKELLERTQNLLSGVSRTSDQQIFEKGVIDQEDDGLKLD